MIWASWFSLLVTAWQFSPLVLYTVQNCSCFLVSVQVAFKGLQSECVGFWCKLCMTVCVVRFSALPTWCPTYPTDA